MAETYESLNEKLGGRELLSGRNGDGENVVIGRGDGFVYVETFQGNGWTRLEYYYEDGTVEETYSR